MENMVVCGNYAAIDIGSNAVRLLIKKIDTNDEGLYCSKEQMIRVPLRLGFDVFTNGSISRSKVDDLVRLIISYENIMNIYKVIDYKVCATSAIRDASNGQAIVKEIEEQTGLLVDVLSGEDEAMLIYQNHAECIQDRNGHFMYVDVGGGSTEIIMLVNGVMVSSNAYNIGTIRVLNGTDDAGEWERLKSDMQKLAEQYSPIDIIGSGGNINKLYKIVWERDNKFKRIKVRALAEIHARMCKMTLENRVKMFQLRYDRADVIVPAAAIFLTIAKTLRSNYIYVPTIGLVDGIVDDLFISKVDELERCMIASNTER